MHPDVERRVLLSTVISVPPPQHRTHFHRHWPVLVIYHMRASLAIHEVHDSRAPYH